MPETKYGKFIIREPITKEGSAPSVHICGEKHLYGEEYCPGSYFPDFPNEVTLFTVTEPCIISAKHAHDYDELLYFLGGNPLNFFEYGAEAEIFMGEEDEKHIINTTTIIYVPKGLMHCPINFKRVDKPVMFMHICSAPAYKRSKGDLTTGHPVKREKYTPEEAIKLRGVKPEGK
jgi:mannose-6-phosphate isomerase-like protein (cupin superfamily)